MLYIRYYWPPLAAVDHYRGRVTISRVIVATHDVWRGMVAPVRICRNAFVGIGAIPLPGITVGPGRWLRRAR